MTIEESSLLKDPVIKELLTKIPDGFDINFNDNQLQGLKIALANRTWRSHPIDFRNSIGLLTWRYYFVFIAGRDFRTSRKQSRPLFKFTEAIFLSLLLIFIGLFGILIVYLIKSALGIDIFPNFSFGVWGWFKGVFLAG